MRPRTRSLRARRGYTLPELMVSLGVLFLLLGGVVSVFLMMLRLSSSVVGASLSSTDAATALQRVTMALREADHFSLPGDLDNGYAGPAAMARDANGNTVLTGIQITFPAQYPAPISYTTGAGVTPAALMGTSLPYSVGTVGTATLTFYRANWHQPGGADGTANPTSGNCLWVTGTENGVTVTPGPVIKTIAATADAVQFIVPRQPDGVTPIANEVEIKIVSGQYDAVHGTVSSDSASGGTTALTGVCVNLSNHNPTPHAPGGANGKRFYFGG